MNKSFDPIKHFWNFFKSVRFTVSILTLLIFSCILGTLIAQKPQVNIPIEELYSPLLFRILDFFSLFDLYHSWWFTLLLGLFLINLFVCVTDKIPQYIKQFKTDLSRTGLETLKTATHYKELTTLNIAKLKTIIKTKLKGFNHVPEKDSSCERFYLAKGRLSIFNPLVVHIGILLIMLGAIWGSIFGYEGQVTLRNNQTTSTFNIVTNNNTMILPLGFALKCNEFKIEYYTDKNKNPKQYYSDLEIIKNKKSIKKETIYVNKPLFYNDLNIYQSSYGSDPLFSFKVVNKTTKKEYHITAALNEKQEIGETKATLIPIRYSDDFKMGMHVSLGPAVLVHLNTGTSMTAPFWLLQQYPYIKTQPHAAWDIDLVEIKDNFYTVLLITKSPGIWLIWLGAIILILGLFLICFYKYERFYIIIDKSTAVTHIIAKASRLPINLENYFNKIILLCKDV